MTPPSPDQALGAYLKSLREGAGLDASVLARRVSLSPAQLSQLEQGQDSLFYNRRIREQAARKVIAHLGGDLAQVRGAVPSAAASLPQPGAEGQAAPAAELAVALPAPTQPHPRKTSGSLLVLGGLLFLMVLAAAYLAVSRSTSAAGGSGPSPASALSRAEPEPPVAVAAAPAQAQAPAALEVAAAPAPTAAAEPVREAAPEPARESVRSAAAAAVASSSACPGDAASPPSIQPPQAYKAGNMVHVVSQAAVWVCLTDGNGKLSRKRMEAGQAQSFYGPSPWVVRSEQLRQTQLYFQGWKVRLPEQAQDSVQLVELR